MKAQTFIDTIKDNKHKRQRERFSSVRFTQDVSPPKFACPICQQRYPTVEAMFACFKRPVAPGRFNVGDLVIVGKGWCRDTWQKSPWHAFTVPARPKAASHFDQVDTDYLWFVITSLWHEDHREVASLISLPSEDEIQYGWNPTTEQTHCDMWTEADVINGKLGHREGRYLESDVDDAFRNYWINKFKGVTVKMPDGALRAEAKLLADAKLVTTTLL